MDPDESTTVSEETEQRRSLPVGMPSWRFWITTIIAFSGVVAAGFVAFNTGDIVVHLKRQSDARLKTEVGRTLQDFQEFLYVMKGSIPDSVRAVSKRMSGRGLGRSSSLVRGVERVVDSAIDSIDSRWRRLTRTHEDLLFDAGYECKTLGCVDFLVSESEWVSELKLSREELKERSINDVRDLIERRGLQGRL